MRVRLALAVVALVWTVLPGPAVAQQPAWSARGPAGAVRPSYREHLIAGVAPTWPVDRAIFAVADDWLVRSDDDGATWTYLPRRFDRVRFIWPAPGVDRQGIVLALRGDPLDSASVPLLRSGDGGTTWEQVLSVQSPLRLIGNVQLTYSPAFAEDGTAFLVCGGQLFRTEDAGRTWRAIDLGPIGASMAGAGVLAQGQLAQQVQLSPAFAQDRTAFLTLGTATYFPFPSTAHITDLSYGNSAVEPSVHERTSVGVAVSHDGGLSWPPASDGLEVAGEPHRFVRNLVVSPTFAADQALFAWAWGPPEPLEVEGLQRLGFANALFRSQDGGASWRPIWNRPQVVTDLGWGYTQSLGIAVSPGFATDGLLLVTTLPLVKDGDNVWLGEYGDRGPCELRRSRDGGASWETLDTPPISPPNRPSACGEPRFVASDPAHFLVGGGPLGGRIIETRDSGTTWSQPNRPPQTPVWSLILGVAPDGSILVRGAEKSGLWIYGALPRPEPSPPACRVELDGARFGAVAKKFSLDRWYGCASAPAANVPMRERVVGSARGIWIDDDSPDWWLLRKDATSAVAERHDKLTEPWAGPPSRVVDGVVQHTWGGELFELPLPDGRRQAYAISANRWETTDPGS